MFISEAFAQAAGGAQQPGFIQAMLPLVLIFAIFWFLIIRPQQKKMKQHREKIGAIRRGDKVVTGGGIVGTVHKVVDDEQVSVEIADGVRVRVMRGLIADVLTKTEPVSGGDKGGDKAGENDGDAAEDGNTDAPANDQPAQDKPKGGLMGLLGKK